VASVRESHSVSSTARGSQCLGIWQWKPLGFAMLEVSTGRRVTLQTAAQENQRPGTRRIRLPIATHGVRSLSQAPSIVSSPPLSHQSLNANIHHHQQERTLMMLMFNGSENEVSFTLSLSQTLGAIHCAQPESKPILLTSNIKVFVRIRPLPEDFAAAACNGEYDKNLSASGKLPPLLFCLFIIC
jgi:hypothetical protein